MMRSLFSGVSGLKTHQTRMDVIGNNIANVNTTAFKSKNVNFSDMLYQTTQAASGPNADAGTGGINARQIGLGVKTAAINTTITQEGANQSTGNPFDLKLTGEAFFVVSDGKNTYYTRDGAFNVDEAGNLCMASTGYIVQGWGVDPATGAVRQGSVGNLNLMSRSAYDPAATTAATISGIIDKTDAALETEKGRIMNLQVLDKLGYEYNLQFGILPQTVVKSGTRDIYNTETAYDIPTNLYKVDTSKLEYSYTVGTETRYLSATDAPDLLKALDETIWKAVGGTTGLAGTPTFTSITPPATTAGYALGAKNTATVTINNAFLTANNLTLLPGSELQDKTITVTFSGDTGYVKSTTPPTYPLGANVNISKISDDAVKLFYTSAAAANGVQAFTVVPSRSNVTTIKQSYTDDDGNAVTDYIFREVNATTGAKADLKYNNGAAANATTGVTTGGADIPSSWYSEIMKIMRLGDQNPKIQDSYYTKENKDTTSVDPGRYTVTLLGMSSYGNEVDISNLKAGGTTSWDLAYNADNGKFSYIGTDGNKDFTLALSSIDGKFSNVKIDWSDTTSVFNEGKSTVTGLKDDGFTVGKLKGVSIAQDGIITANYTNGMAATIGQICVGTFANAMGLQNAGDNLYSETPNSGDCRTVDIKASGTGYMTTGMLEMSNVDLSNEFTSMITTQRGFQANSRIITTSDTLLEELINLKR